MRLRNTKTGKEVSTADLAVRIARYEIGPDPLHCLSVELTHLEPERWALRKHVRLCWSKSLQDWVPDYRPEEPAGAAAFYEDCRFDTAEEAIEIAKREALNDTGIACWMLGINWAMSNSHDREKDGPLLVEVEEAEG